MEYVYILEDSYHDPYAYCSSMSKAVSLYLNIDSEGVVIPDLDMIYTVDSSTIRKVRMDELF